MAKKLFIPGPVEVAPEILQAMATPDDRPPHAGVRPAPQGCERKTQEGSVYRREGFSCDLQRLRRDGGGGAGTWWRKRCANFCNGAFSDKWHDVTRRCGKEADHSRLEWGKPVTPELVDQALSTGKYDAVTLIHNETSTGVMSPLPDIAAVLRNYPDVVSIIDTVSSMSALNIPVDELGIDCCIFGVQKAFALPPGTCCVYRQSEGTGKMP